MLKFNTEYYDFKGDNLYALNNYLSNFDSGNVLNTTEIKFVVTQFHDIYSAINLFVPLKCFEDSNFPA